MQLLSILIGTLIQSAHAVTLEQIGSAGPGVSQMWNTIIGTFPHTSAGNGALALIALRIISFVLSLIGGAATAVMIYAGIKMVMSRGQDEGLSEAKKIALYALLGVILALLADVIVFFVCSFLAPRLAGGSAPGACSLIF